MEAGFPLYTLLRHDPAWTGRGPGRRLALARRFPLDRTELVRAHRQDGRRICSGLTRCAAIALCTPPD